MNTRLHDVGRLGRPRGLEGWIRFEPVNAAAASLVSENQIFYVSDKRSGYRPLRVMDVYTEEKRNTVSFFVKFDMITNRTEAEEVKDKALYSDRFDPEADDISDVSGTQEVDLTGYDLITAESDEPIGSVLDIMESPAHSIIEAKIDKGSLLIPFVDEYVADVSHSERVIYCRNLDQLMEDE